MKRNEKNYCSCKEEGNVVQTRPPHLLPIFSEKWNCCQIPKILRAWLLFWLMDLFEIYLKQNETTIRNSRSPFSLLIPVTYWKRAKRALILISRLYVMQNHIINFISFRVVLQMGVLSNKGIHLYRKLVRI